jgi:rSAM/selenodomain-associated transferase 2
MLSIIIPIYNEAKHLPKQLTFLDRQADLHPIEIILSNSIDTTDNSAQISKSYKNVQFYDSFTKGRAKQMNFGASKAKGDILMFLHCDVQLPEDFYKQVTSAVKEGHKMGFFAYRFDRSTFMLNLNSYFTKNDSLFAGAGDQCQFFEANTFEELGGFDENYCIMEDFEIMDRIRKEKVPFKIIQSRATVSARKYDHSTWLEVNLINGYVFLLYKLGVKPLKLRKIYKGFLREGV